MKEKIRDFACKAGAYVSEPNDWKMIDFDLSKMNLEKFAELVEKDAESRYYSAGYISGQSDGHIDAVLLCVDHLVSAGANELAYEIKTQFGAKEWELKDD